MFPICIAQIWNIVVGAGTGEVTTFRLANPKLSHRLGFNLAPFVLTKLFAELGALLEAPNFFLRGNYSSLIFSCIKIYKFMHTTKQYMVIPDKTSSKSSSSSISSSRSSSSSVNSLQTPSNCSSMSVSSHSSSVRSWGL